ncbi:D-glycero-D-manno-heptose 1-phosphate guanosyltransferase [Sulfurimonas diazotrophicus]|uniref:Nucleotidyltransferase family protein n=1 Tax=Sulfurimonas diazotrophicus TaxID=3131939 RepID=A0ABZ3H9P4_9BACT
MEAIVLAGGLGTRLRSVVSELPKPMAPVGGKPFLEYIFQYLKKNGIERIVLSVGYKWESIRDYFGEEYEGMALIYSVEDEPLGTGGAIKKAFESVKSENVFIINGDTFFDVPLQTLNDQLNPDSKLLLSLKRMHRFDRYGCVESDSTGKVTAFTEKGYRESGNINGGVYLASADLFESFDLDEKFSFEAFMEEYFDALGVRAVVFDGYFIDIGIPEDYSRAEDELKEHV